MQAQAVDTISVNATRGWFQCGKSALQKLAEAEANLFAAAGLNLISRLVAIPFKNSQIYTVTQNAEENKALEPIVLLHGFGGGVAIWSACIKSLARHHTVHAIDLLGFGRSSRPTFSKQPDEAEKEMISAIEEWRSAMDIEKMHLVGHSFGAFLASSYALKYPERVKHLILADPWGFSEAYPSSVKEYFPGTFKSSLVNFVLLFNPFAVLRVTGGYAPSLIKKARPDLMRRYPSQHEDDIYNYIYYCNSQSPTGETAFKRMSHMLGWAKIPLYSRFSELNPSVPVSFVLGAHSWVDHEPAYQLQAQARNQIDIKAITSTQTTQKNLATLYNELWTDIGDSWKTEITVFYIKCTYGSVSINEIPAVAGHQTMKLALVLAFALLAVALAAPHKGKGSKEDKKYKKKHHSHSGSDSDSKSSDSRDKDFNDSSDASDSSDSSDSSESRERTSPRTSSSSSPVTETTSFESSTIETTEDVSTSETPVTEEITTTA